MRIALLGAPGAGKTKVARRLARRLNVDTPHWAVIDGYVDRLAKRTGLPFGSDVSYQSFQRNLQVMAERWTLEDEAEHKGFHSITCGTVYESIIYTAAPSMAIPFLKDEDIVLEESRLAYFSMHSLGALEQRTFDYDAMFYLPLAHEDHGWNGVVDAKLPEILEGFFRYAVLLEGTDQQKVDYARTIIEAIQEASTTPPDEQQAV